MDSKDFMAIVCNIVDPKLTMSEKDVIKLIEEKFTNNEKNKKRKLNSIIKPRVTKEDFKKLKAVDKMLEKLGKENQKIRKEFDLDKEK